MEQLLRQYVNDNRDRLIEIVRELVRRPSENTAPKGAELECQRYVAEFLGRLGWEASLYELEQVPGLTSHALFWPGRDYSGRPNVGARLKGAGGGRSLVLSGHIDTVPAGSQAWKHDPFGGEVEGNLLYGRGSNDMKAGVATNLFVAEAIGRLGLRLAGELVVETVVDEEFGGVNGTLAGRLAGFNADAAVISEPSFLRICPAQRGGRVAHITLSAPAQGILTAEGNFPLGVIDRLRTFLNELPRFAGERKRKAEVHPMYAAASDPVPVAVLKLYTGPWGTGEPMAAPEECRIELYWQLMPGERQEDVEREFFAWLDGVFEKRPRVEFPIRWMPGSAIAKNEPLVAELAAAAAVVMGKEPVIAGIEGPCDMYIFHQEFGIPAVLWGARGGNTHAPDEYVEIDSAVTAAEALLLFVCRWCGVVN